MKRFLLAASMALAAIPAFADTALSLSVGQPGFYGRIDIGSAPRPVLVYPEPVVIETAPVAQQPIYLHVPRYETKEWRKYCRKYGACGQPVYFVEDSWYNDEYVPYYHRQRRRSQVVYAHDIHSDVVRARVIRAHDVHADDVRARVVYEVKGKFDGPHGEDIDAPVVEAGEIQAHDIHARVVEADTLYVHKLH